MRRSALAIAVGAAAIFAPALHVASDAIEILRGGFSVVQLRLNYVAFVAMPWLLLGILAVRGPQHSIIATLGAILYGAAFTYFAFTTLYALTLPVPNYAELWASLGATYTLHGALMIVGGLMFALPVLRAGTLPRRPVQLFIGGLLLNLAAAIAPVPDIVQVAGSAVRNAGLIGMGAATLRQAWRISES